MSTRPTAPLLVTAALVFAAAAPMRIVRRPAPAEPVPAGCYAFRRQGRVWVACGSKAQPVSNHSYWAGFAVSPKGDYLAARGGTWALHGNPVVRRHRALLVPLGGGKVIWRLAPGAVLVPTCGTVEVSGSPPMDLVTGLALRFGGAAGLVACDNSRKWVLAKFAAQPTSSESIPIMALYLLGGPKLTPLAANVGDFAVSPNGTSVAFEASATLGHNHLCSSDLSSPQPSCTRSTGVIFDFWSFDSVSNAGEVIFNSEPDISSNAVCEYEGLVGVWKVGHTKLYPGKREGSGPCPVVFYWRPGQSKPAILQRMADEAQWITQDAAKALIDGYRTHRWPLF
ncbi:MAG: hypothetical protein ACRD2H_07205 [Terriglobales bacterium]